MITATATPPKHIDGNGMHGVPPVHFEDERVYVKSVSADRRTVTLTAPLHYTHISTSYTRPDGEFIDLSAEAAPIGLCDGRV